MVEHVEASDYKTVEALVTAVTKEPWGGCKTSEISMGAEKPSALTFAKGRRYKKYSLTTRMKEKQRPGSPFDHCKP